MAASVAGDEDDKHRRPDARLPAGRGGEVSARNRAAKLAQAYLALDDAGRRGFLRDLASFDCDPDAVAAPPTRCARPNRPGRARAGRQVRCAARWSRRARGC